jgi:hypothetical protein
MGARGNDSPEAKWNRLRATALRRAFGFRDFLDINRLGHDRQRSCRGMRPARARAQAELLGTMSWMTRWLVFAFLCPLAPIHADPATTSTGDPTAGSTDSRPAHLWTAEYADLLWNDTKAVLTAPARWNGDDWTSAGLATAAIGGTPAFDKTIKDHVQAHRTSGEDRFMKQFQELGSTWSFGVLAGFEVWGEIGGDSTGKAVALVGLTASIIGPGLIGTSVKYAVGRVRRTRLPERSNSSPSAATSRSRPGTPPRLSRSRQRSLNITLRGGCRACATGSPALSALPGSSRMPISRVMSLPAASWDGRSHARSSTAMTNRSGRIGWLGPRLPTGLAQDCYSTSRFESKLQAGRPG